MFTVYPDDNNHIYNTMFSCDKTKSFFASSRIGILLNEDTYSPNDCGSFGINKLLATKKAFSESVERRSLSGSSSNEILVQTIDIFSGCVKEINKNNFYFADKGCLDTTSTAADTNGNYAVYNSILELIEKNATMLFWYNNEGYQLYSESMKNILINITGENYDHKVFINDSFYPVLVVYVFLYVNGHPIVVGTGSGLSLKYSLEKAVNEAVFLAKIENDNNSIIDYKGMLYDNYTSMKKKSFDDINTERKLSSYSKKESFNWRNENNISIKDLKLSLRRFTNHLYIHSLSVSYKKLICIRSFSPELINYVPFKQNLKFDRKIYHRISRDVLKNDFPDNPIM